MTLLPPFRLFPRYGCDACGLYGRAEGAAMAADSRNYGGIFRVYLSDVCRLAEGQHSLIKEGART